MNKTISLIFSSRYIYLLTALFFIVSFVGIINHEIWLDEAHHWLLARESSSLNELLYNTRYEGHPILWNILLFIITRFTHDVFWMQCFHVIISTATIFVFLKKAPFNIAFKILFIFGYFMLFEYTLLSRNYMLGVLFLFLALSYYKERKSKFFMLCLLLVIASNTHLIFFVISSGIMLLITIEHFKAGKLFNKKNLLGYSLFFIGIIVLTIQIIPPKDSSFFNEINNLSVFKRSLKGFISLWNGLICVPDFRTIHFWNTNIFVNLSKPLTAIFALLIYLLPILLFHKKKNILFFVFITLIGMQAFFFVTQRGNARSEGVVFLIFIIGLWIEQYYSSNPLKITNRIKETEVLKKIIVYSILSIHFFSGTIAYAIDYKYPFTPAKRIANYINNHHPDKIIITDFWDAPTSSYKGHTIYSLCQQDYKSFCHWNVICKTDILNSEERRLEVLNAFMKNKKTSCIFITLKPITLLDFHDENLNEFQIKFLTTFKESIIPNRDYTIYEVN